MLAGSGQQLLESLDWTIVEVTLGPDSQRLVHGPCELKCCERTPEDKTYDIYLARGRVQWEGLHCGTTGSWDSGVQIWDGRCCERTLDELPTDGLWNDKSVCLICV